VLVPDDGLLLIAGGNLYLAWLKMFRVIERDNHTLLWGCCCLTVTFNMDPVAADSDDQRV
jgi:hypothetical protein